MKQFTLILIIAFFTQSIVAQTPADTVKYWKKGGNFSVNFSQVSFSNWAAGGKNSFAGVGLLNYSANYAKDRMSWDNSLNMGYGLLKEQNRSLVKSDDKFEVNSKVGYKMTESGKWFLTGMVNFRTQFADGFNYPANAEPVLISSFLSPAYLTFAVGFDYKPSDNFSLFLAPLASKFTFVTNDSLSAQGAFGVDPGKKFRAEMGGNIRSELKFKLMKNVDGATSITLFSNYLKNPQNVDVNWDFRLNMKINEFLSANFLTNLIYDDDILVPILRNGVESKGRRIQMKQLFGVGLNVKL